MLEGWATGCFVLAAATLVLVTSASADQHVLVHHRELLEVRTATADTLVLMYRDGDRSDPPPTDAAAYRINGQQVREVGRHTAPIYVERNVDWSTQRYPSIIMHRIYLVLDEPLRDGVDYVIEHPDGQTTLSFDSRSVRSESIKVNQLGYNPVGRSPRAFFAAWLGDKGGRGLDGVDTFHVHDAATDERVFSGEIEPAARDENAGEPAYVMELAGLAAAGGDGRYYLVVPGVGRSAAFGYGEAYGWQSFYVHMKGFYHQRCGVALEEPYTRWTRGLCHPVAQVTDAQPPGFIEHGSDIEIASIGGHHDAGDFSHYPTHTLVAGWLLNAYELTPEKFDDGQLNLPESGNGIPDLLDEALFAVKRWETLQEDDGAVRAGMEPARHPTYGQVDAATDQQVHRTYGRYGHTTLAGAALFAYASRLVEPFDGARAGELARRAERAWGFYERHRDDDAYEFSFGVTLFASGQLYLLTGEQGYHEVFLDHARRLIDGDTQWPAQYKPTYFNHQTVMGGMVFTHYFVSYLLAPGRERDEEVARGLGRMIIDNADDAVRRIEGRRWAYYSTDGWGRSTGVGRKGDFLVHAHHLTGDQRYLDAASRSVDFLLGANPAGWSFTSGLGDRPPYNPLQLDAYTHIHNGMGPTPGLTIYGIASVSRAPYVQVIAEKVHPSLYDEQRWPALRRISDGWPIISQAEFTVWETMAPNALLHAYLAPQGDWSGAVFDYGQPRLPGGYPAGALRGQ